MKDLIFKLCKCSGVSGNEEKISDCCKDIISKYTTAEKDYNNNIIAVFGNEKADKTILLDAHLDQIGLIVTDIDENGFIKADKCGGIDLRTLPDSPVIVHGRQDLKGVVCCMPPHLSDGKEDLAITIDKVWIDLGLPCEKVRELVSVGNVISLYSEPKTLLNNRVCSPALDNRAGVAVLLKVCEIISNKELNCKVVVLLSCQEETFGTGAKTKSFKVDADECICVDVSFANQSGVKDQYSNIELGNGPMICVSPNLNRNMVNKLKSIAENKNIPYQIEVCNGRTGTNADHITVSKNGIKTAVLSVPLRNMHTQGEIADIDDIENTAYLISQYINTV